MHLQPGDVIAFPAVRPILCRAPLTSGGGFGSMNTARDLYLEIVRIGA